MAKGKVEVLEFFSGIGGLHYGLISSSNNGGVDLKRIFDKESMDDVHVQSFDLSPVANSIYQFNFPSHPPPFHRDVCQLSAQQLDAYSASVWLLSPPCQPYTRQGRKRDIEDPRAKPLLHLIKKIQEMSFPPLYLLLENVKGFDLSESRRLLLEGLKAKGYNYHEFLLSPQDFGIPNSRLRYFCVAKRKPLTFIRSTTTNDILTRVPGSLHFIPPPTSTIPSTPEVCSEISAYLDPTATPETLTHFLLPEKILQTHGYVLDVVTPLSRRSCCFTKAYTHYAEGTGSVLQTRNYSRPSPSPSPPPLPPPPPSSSAPSSTSQTWDWRCLIGQGLRYFTPREVASLHHFPSSFHFPPTLNSKKQYGLLGNSLNVAVVSELLVYLFKEGNPANGTEPMELDTLPTSSSTSPLGISLNSPALSLTSKRKRVLILEAFYGGSHKQLVDLLTSSLLSETDTTVITLSAKKWHWKLRSSALQFATAAPKKSFDVLFSSATVNLAELFGLRPDLGSIPKKILYFHENQLCYPVRPESKPEKMEEEYQPEGEGREGVKGERKKRKRELGGRKQDERDFQHAWAQIVSALVCDEVVFNSKFNRDSFLEGIQPAINKYLPSDCRVQDVTQRLRPKSRVLYFPLAPPVLPLPLTDDVADKKGPLKILWSHRWEFDKNPELFFETLFKLDQDNIPFTVSVLGEQYSEPWPPIFYKAKELLEKRITHWGYQPDKVSYLQVVKNSDVVVSTSNHEFYGVSVLEGVLLGCLPLCPNRLVYPELLPSQYLYSTPQQLYKRLKSLALDCSSASSSSSSSSSLSKHRERNGEPVIDVTPFLWTASRKEKGLREDYAKLFEVNSNT